MLMACSLPTIPCFLLAVGSQRFLYRNRILIPIGWEDFKIVCLAGRYVLSRLSTQFCFSFLPTPGFQVSNSSYDLLSSHLLKVCITNDNKKVTHPVNHLGYERKAVLLHLWHVNVRRFPDFLKVVTNEKGEASGAVLTIRSQWVDLVLDVFLSF